MNKKEDCTTLPVPTPRFNDFKVYREGTNSKLTGSGVNQCVIFFWPLAKRSNEIPYWP